MDKGNKRESEMTEERTIEQVVRDLDAARGMRDTARYALGYAGTLGMVEAAQAANALVEAATLKVNELKAEYEALGGLRLS